MGLFDGEDGRQAGRDFLVRVRDRTERATTLALPVGSAQVASVEGNLVTLVGDVAPMPYVDATVSVGDRGLVFPVSGGGRMFFRTGAHDLTAVDDLAQQQAQLGQLIGAVQGEVDATAQDVFDLSAIVADTEQDVEDVEDDLATRPTQQQLTNLNTSLTGIIAAEKAALPVKAGATVQRAERTTSMTLNTGQTNQFYLFLDQQLPTGWHNRTIEARVRLRAPNGTVTARIEVNRTNQAGDRVAREVEVGTTAQEFVVMTDQDLPRYTGANYDPNPGIFMGHIAGAFRQLVIESGSIRTVLERRADIQDVNDTLGGLQSQQQGTSGVVSDIVGNLLPQKLPIVDAPVTRRLVANSETTSTSQTPIGNLFPTNDALAFPLAANTRYVLTATLDYQGSTTDGGFNGARFGIVLPGGATLQGSQTGYASSAEPIRPTQWNTPGLPFFNWSFNDTQMRRLEIRAFIQMGSTAGIGYVGMAVMQAGEKITVLAGSSIATLEKSN